MLQEGHDHICLPLRDAMEQRDLAAVADSLSQDVVFHSPLTRRLRFHGRDQITDLTRVILEVLEDFRYTDQVVSGNVAFLTAEARVKDQPLEIAERWTMDSSGRVEEITVFFRPLPASALALRLIGAGILRRRSPVKAAFVSTLARPLAFMARSGDRVGASLIGSAM